MATSVINEPDLALDRHDGNIFVITMRKAPENRLDSAYCQRLIAAFNLVRTTLGSDSEGAVITRGNDAKFWCTVSSLSTSLFYLPASISPSTPLNCRRKVLQMGRTNVRIPCKSRRKRSKRKKKQENDETIYPFPIITSFQKKKET